MPAVLNAANEVAVEAFVGGKLSFGGIARLVERTMQAHDVRNVAELTDVLEADRWARAHVRSIL